MPGILHQQLFHKCMRIVLKLTHLDMHQYHVVTGPDGSHWLTMVIVMAWIADLEEQLLAGIWTYSCLVCTTSYHNLDHWHGAVSHTPQLPEVTLSETHQVHTLFPDASIYEFKKEMKKHDNGLSGAIEEFCWEGLPVGPHIFLTQDLLHGSYKFVWDHIAKWLVHIMGEEELNHCFKAQPYLGFQNFADGISKISQVTGHEHWTYLRFIVTVIAGHESIDQNCQGASETGNISRPSAHGTPMDLRNRCSRGWVPAECLEQKMLYAYTTVCTQGDFTLSRKWEESCLLILPKPYYI